MPLIKGMLAFSHISFLPIIFCLCSPSQSQDVQINNYINKLCNNPSIKAKKAASQALAEIGTSSIPSLISRLNAVADLNPAEKGWINPDYISDTLAQVRSRGGAEANALLIKALLAADNPTVRTSIWKAFMNSGGIREIFQGLLERIETENILEPNTEWSLMATVRHLVMSPHVPRDGELIAEILAVFEEHGEIRERFPTLRTMVETLETVGTPRDGVTFPLDKRKIVEIRVDEQSEFFLELTRPNGPWDYQWGFGEGSLCHGVDTVASGLLFLGKTVENCKLYLRFIGTEPKKIFFNVYISGGIPEERLKPAFQSVIVIRKLSRQERKKRIEALAQSLDEKQRRYAQFLLKGKTEFHENE